MIMLWGQRWIAVGLVVLVGVLGIFTTVTLGAAQSTGSKDVGAEDQSKQLLTTSVLPVALAVEAATEALRACTEQGHRVTVTIVGSDGLTRAQLRGDGAGPHTIDSSRLKAATAASFRRATADLEAVIRNNPGSTLRDIPDTLLLGGGLPIATDSGEVIGGIGVAGAPGGDLDAACGQAGIDKITSHLK
jgi:uncharacterized protein GlcG (DUF336 family)